MKDWVPSRFAKEGIAGNLKWEEVDGETLLSTSKILTTATAWEKQGISILGKQEKNSLAKSDNYKLRVWQMYYLDRSKF